VTTGSLGHLTDFGFAQGLQPLVRPAKAVGLAYTVRVPHLDGVAVHYALNHIAEGEVLVIDTSGQHNRAAWGGVTAYAAAKAGVVGVVVDGPVTDWEEITESGPPVWCNGGTCSVTGRKMGLEGAVQIPVQVGGAVVHPGDIVLADSDGVFFVRPEGAVELVEKLEKREAREPALKRRLDSGERMADISGAAELAESMGAAG
jgi:regulator of RNase E activity RraA